VVTRTWRRDPRC